MKILVFDNYDSFTYNLVHLVEKILHQRVDVVRNDQLPLERVKEYDKIILSLALVFLKKQDMLLPLIKEYAASKSILGVCLGHQAIGEAFGGKLVNLSTVYHGVATPVNILKRSKKDLYEGLPDTFDAGRYHSWVISEEGFPKDLTITARDASNYIMGLQHNKYDVQGVQFHPESVLTPQGEIILTKLVEAVNNCEQPSIF